MLNRITRKVLVVAAAAAIVGGGAVAPAVAVPSTSWPAPTSAQVAEDVHFLAVVGGSHQTAGPGATFIAPSVRALDATGGPVAGATVSFDVSSDLFGTGTAFEGGGPVEVLTDEDGIAEADRPLVAGSREGHVFVRATSGEATATFFLIVRNTTAERLEVVSGGSQVAEPGQSFGELLLVAATSGEGIAVAGVPVTFTIEATNGTTFADGSVTWTADTDADGIATSAAVRAGESGALSVVASADGADPVRFYLLVA